MAKDAEIQLKGDHMTHWATSHLWKPVYNQPETLLLNCLLDGEAYVFNSESNHQNIAVNSGYFVVIVEREN